MTQARGDFIWLPTEMRPRPDSWPPSTRQRTKMWVAQPAAAEAESRWRRGLTLVPASPPLQGHFCGFCGRLKNSTNARPCDEAPWRQRFTLWETQGRMGGGTKGRARPPGDIIFHCRLRISHVKASKWRAVRHSEDLRIDGDERKCRKHEVGLQVPSGWN